MFGMFLPGAVLCLSFSWLFNTAVILRKSSELDYAGITLLITGSFGPWLYYSFYCSPQPRLICIHRLCSGHLCLHHGTVGPVPHS